MVLLACSSLVLIILVGSILFTSRQQQTAKSPVPPRTLRVPRPTTSPTPPVLFSDTFSDNSQNWDVGTEAKYGSTISSGVLTLTNANHTPFLEPLPSDDEYDDVAVAFTVTLLKGDENDSVGLYFRTNGVQGYSMNIYGDDSFDIAKVTIDAMQKTHVTYLAQSQHSPALHSKGQQNDVMVITKGTTIVLLVNDTIIRSVQDSTFSTGKILLFVQNGDSSDGVTASFNSIAVYKAPERLPN